MVQGLTKEKIAKILVTLRGDRSREEVAKALGISVSTLQMYENAKRVPKDEIKLKIANYYGVPVESIFLIINSTFCVVGTYKKPPKEVS
jgi:putative transcriptional regulator